VVALALAIAALASTASAAAVDRPSWTPGDFWTYRTNTTLTPGLNLTGTATSTVAGMQTMTSGGSTVNAFRVVLSGSGTAAGTVSTPNGNVSVRGDWIVTGEERFEPTNLHVIYSLVDLSVNGTYQNLVPFSIRVQNTTTFEILADRWAYPLPVGGTGSLEVAYAFIQDVYGPTVTPYHENGTGNLIFTFSMNPSVSIGTPAGTYVAYPTDEIWPDGSAQRSWYAPQIGNDVRTETVDPGGNRTSETTLVGYRHQALETPTFLGLTLVEWGIVVPIVAAGTTALAVLWRRARRKKAPRPPEEEAPPELTSGPRGP